MYLYYLWIALIVARWYFDVMFCVDIRHWWRDACFSYCCPCHYFASHFSDLWKAKKNTQFSLIINSLIGLSFVAYGTYKRNQIHLSISRISEKSYKPKCVFIGLSRNARAYDPFISCVCKHSIEFFFCFFFFIIRLCRRRVCGQRVSKE